MTSHLKTADHWSGNQNARKQETTENEQSNPYLTATLGEIDYGHLKGESRLMEVEIIKMRSLGV